MAEMVILTSYMKEEILSAFPSNMKTAGDTKVIFDPENESEVEIAKEQFDSLIKKGFRAYKVDKEGKKTGSPIKKFKAEEGRYIFLPPIQGG